ncbi:hypothetical protein KCU83_g492, partial [Aureobasidium melanogenum]
LIRKRRRRAVVHSFIVVVFFLCPPPLLSSSLPPLVDLFTASSLRRASEYVLERALTSVAALRLINWYKRKDRKKETWGRVLGESNE